MAELRPGTVIGSYRLEKVIGRGGMGVVWLAEHTHLERKVAFKVLSEALSADESFRQRFLRESRTAARLDHPNVVTVFDAGEMDDLLYIAMRYVEGTDLREILREQGYLEPAQTVDILTQVASALDAAHAALLVHRDVKPGNILITSREGATRAYLSDFGLTRGTESVSDITQAGAFLGSIDYAAPEQWKNQKLDARTDVYALGCVLYECLTGQVPFVRDGQVAVMYAHMFDVPPRVTGRDRRLPPAIDDVVRQALAKSPDERFLSCGALIEAARFALEPAIRAGQAPRTRQRTAPPTPIDSGATVPPPAQGDEVATGALAPPGAGDELATGAMPPPMPYPEEAGTAALGAEGTEALAPGTSPLGAPGGYAPPPGYGPAGTAHLPMGDQYAGAVPGAPGYPGVGAPPASRAVALWVGLGILLLVAAAAGAFLLLSGGGDEENKSGDGGKAAGGGGAPEGPTDLIVFRSDRDGDNDIYVMKADGSGVRNLTNDTSEDTDPAWSPDGKEIAFQSDRDGDFDIYVMRANGSGVRNLTNNSDKDTDPAWAPDNASIAFSSDRDDGLGDIFVMSPSGAGQANLTLSPGTTEDDPTWSSDSSRIAFQGDASGNDDVFLISAGGANLRNLTLDNTGSDEDPDFSPIGNEIAFSRDDDAFVLDLATGGLLQVSSEPSRESDPGFSEDGKELVFQSDREGNEDLFVAPATGGKARNITNNSAFDADPDWLP